LVSGKRKMMRITQKAPRPVESQKKLRQPWIFAIFPAMTGPMNRPRK
jgi:hypothetical protein